MTEPTLRHLVCPSCHTPHALLAVAEPAVSDDWLCVRCGQRWNNSRLETVAAYAAWVAEHDRM